MPGPKENSTVVRANARLRVFARTAAETRPLNFAGTIRREAFSYWSKLMTDTTTPTAALQDQLVPDPRIASLAEVFGSEFARDFRDPVRFVTETLRSPAPLSFYRRDFKLLSRYLFLESVYRRRPDFNQELLDNYARMTGEKLAAVQLLLTKRIEQTAALFRNNGITPDAVYLQAQRLTIPIIAAHAYSFISLLIKLDEYYQLTGSASLYGILDGSQRSKAELEGRKAIRSFTALVRNEHIKLRKESLRMRAARGDLVEDDVIHAEKIVQEGQAEYDASENDHGSHVSLDEAGAVLDSLVATGVAAANAADRKRPAKVKADSHAPTDAADAGMTGSAPVAQVIA